MGQQDAYSKTVDRWGGVAATAAQLEHGIPAGILDLAARIEGFSLMARRVLHVMTRSPGWAVSCSPPVTETKLPPLLA